MAREAMTYEDVVESTGLDARTIRGIARGDHRPQARTLHRLAEGLGVATDQLFKPPTGISPAAFDAATNPAVERIKATHPDLFANWSADDYAELASRFGIGGQLTEQGTIDAARKMNAKRAVLQRAQVVMETAHADLLTQLINLLYERVQIDE